MCALCSVDSVESTKQAQRLQTGLCLHNIKGQWCRRSARALMILVLSTGVNGDEFRMGAERCWWICVQTVAPLYPKCAISQSQTMNSQRSTSNELQYNVKVDLILILKKNSYYFLKCICFSVAKEGQYNKESLDFFWLLIDWFGFFVASS